jgi:hypothetical protein
MKMQFYKIAIFMVVFSGGAGIRTLISYLYKSLKKTLIQRATNSAILLVSESCFVSINPKISNQFSNKNSMET